MPQQSTSAVCESLELPGPKDERRERLQSAARKRLAMHVPNQSLARGSQQTINSGYRSLLREAAASGEALNVVLESRSSRAVIQFGKYCVRHFETLALIETLNALGKCCTDDKDESLAIDQLLEKIEISLERLDQAEAARLPTQPRCRTRASRLKLHPAGWQEQLISSAPKKLKIGLLILCLTGCRPCEIERGIEFSIGLPDSDVRLTLDICGAKCDEHRGQPLRTFQFLTEDVRPMVALLIGTLSDLQAATPGSIFRLAGVRFRIFRHAVKLWPDHHARPTAYSFRYAFREHMALLGATRNEIARAMGHRSIRSSMSYGRHVQRERSQEIEMEISATFEPRLPHQFYEYGDQLRERSGATRLVARDIAHDVYSAEQC